MTSTQRLEKWLSQYPFSTQKEIQESLDFIACYKTIARTKKEAMYIIYEKMKSIAQLQKKRKAQQYKKPQLTLLEQYYEKVQKEIKRSFSDTFGTPSGGIETTIKKGAFAISTKRTRIYKTYGKRDYPKTLVAVTISIPDMFRIKRDRQVPEFDGIFNLSSKCIRTINNIKVYTCEWLKKSKGYDFSIQSGFVASNGEKHYHAETIKKAVNGVLRKISRKEDRHTITENSYMSKTKYHRITGACYSGISLWCAMQGIDENSRIKISDLLPILEKTKAYGYHNLLNALNQ